MYELLLNFEVNKPSALVYAHLSDMQKFVSVHPVIYKIERLDTNNYLVFEKLRFGMLTHTFRYTVNVIDNAMDNTIYMKARVMGLVKIELIFCIKREGATTKVSEVITFKTFLPVKRLIGRIFTTHHNALFSNISKLQE
jgi:carbon monoxide dehydrogenase subunit G